MRKPLSTEDQYRRFGTTEKIWIFKGYICDTEISDCSTRIPPRVENRPIRCRATSRRQTGQETRNSRCYLHKWEFSVFNILSCGEKCPKIWEECQSFLPWRMSFWHDALCDCVTSNKCENSGFDAVQCDFDSTVTSWPVKRVISVKSRWPASGGSSAPPWPWWPRTTACKWLSSVWFPWGTCSSAFCARGSK